MNFVRLLPVFISIILLAAHFVRAGQSVIAIVLLCLLVLLFVRKTWVIWVMQAVLLLGALEWLYTLYNVAQIRAEYGMPWARMAVILGVVALFTGLSALVFWSKGLQTRYSDRKLVE